MLLINQALENSTLVLTEVSSENNVGNSCLYLKEDPCPLDICMNSQARNSFLFLKKNLLEDNCIAILFWFLLYINMNQLQVYICRLPLEPASHVPPHPIPLGCHGVLS